MKGFVRKLVRCLCILFFLGRMGNSVYAADMTTGTEIAPVKIAENTEPIVVVLDPGHGGENLGAEYNGYTEKEMTMIVAQAMREELEKYEGIKVYMTREGDEDLTLEERAEYAKSVNADFMFCLHFNMSENHNLFGAEVWVSAFGERYQEGYSFASVEMELLEELGVYSRGIKTRLNDEGEDYYGIIRYSTARELTTVLIEHCHLDQKNDVDFYTSEEKLRQFGRLDATAVAKYYGLRSEVLGVDYSWYEAPEIPEPLAPVKPDHSESDICVIEVESVDNATGEAAISVLAEDYDSYILYYAYSYDGGETYSELQRWEPRDADHLIFTMKIPSGIIPEIVVKVHNGFDRVKESNRIALPSVAYEEPEEVVEAGSMNAENNLLKDVEGNPALEADSETGKIPAEQSASETRSKRMMSDRQDESYSAEKNAEEKNAAGTAKSKETQITFVYFLQVSFVCMGLLFVLFLFARILTGGKLTGKKHRTKKKRHSKKKRSRKK